MGMHTLEERQPSRASIHRHEPPTSSVPSTARSPGQLLPRSLASQLTPVAGHDLSNVRVHTDSESARHPDALDANAYTFGDDIVFGPDQYRPNTPAGKALIAHELGHVVAQREGGRPRVQLDLKARNRTRVDYLPNYGGMMDGGGSTTSTSESAEASSIRSALAALIADGKVAEVRSTNGATSWFTANHHKDAELGPIRDALAAAGYPLADRMARAVYDIHGEYLFSGVSISTSSLFWSTTRDLGAKVRRQETRSLTEWEIRQARRVFQSAINYSRVNVEDDSEVMSRLSRGATVTLGNTIYFPGNDSRSMGLMIHELTHVWQYQTTGWTYAPKALWAQVTEGYSYTPQGKTPDDALRDARAKGKTLTSFNKEQQGDILADYYRRLQGGGDVTAYQPFADDVAR